MSSRQHWEQSGLACSFEEYLEDALKERTLANQILHKHIAELEAKVGRLEKEKAEQYQRAQFYRGVLQEIRDNTPAGQPNDWPHHHWYLSKASKAINHVALEGKQE